MSESPQKKLCTALQTFINADTELGQRRRRRKREGQVEDGGAVRESNQYLESLFTAHEDGQIDHGKSDAVGEGGNGSDDGACPPANVRAVSAAAPIKPLITFSTIPLPMRSALPPAFVPPLFSAPSGVASAGSVPNNTADAGLGLGGFPETMTQATEAYYKRLNPHFERTELLIVPRHDPPRHNGVACGPNERLIQVARYGRIYKRKNPIYLNRSMHRNAPAGHRFCRMCNGYLPLSAFYTHITRYVCKRHHAERKYATEVVRFTHDQTDLIVYDMWVELNAAVATLGYRSVNFDYRDIRSIMIFSGIPFSMTVRALPIDPSIPMRPRNLAIVGKETFDLLVKGYQHMCSRALYIASVQRCNLIPPQLDVGWPENPYHDPTYRRQDIDVGPLLMAELSEGGAALDNVDRTRIEWLIDAEPPAPWITHAPTLMPLTYAMRERWKQHESRLKMIEEKTQGLPDEEAAKVAAGLRSGPPPGIRLNKNLLKNS